MTLIDDVFDVLEGAFAELVRVRLDPPADRIEVLMHAGRLRGARVAVAGLAALLRAGHTWRPAADGYEAREWADTIGTTAREIGAESLLQTMMSRELAELVALAPPDGARRRLPETGTVEQLARAAGVDRAACRTWARAHGRDHAGAWDDCDVPEHALRIALALGASRAELISAICAGVHAALPDSRSPLAGLLASAARGDAVDPDSARREQLTAPPGRIEADAAIITSSLAQHPRPSLLGLQQIAWCAARALGMPALRGLLALDGVRAQLAARSH